jgi:IS5 family transposase
MAYNRCEQYDIFTQIFQEPLQKDHELLLLAKRIEWDEITDRLMPFYSTRGRQAKRIRLMVGLHILKHRFDVSDEVVVKGLHENVYWMVFCGVKLQAQYLNVGEGRVEVRPCLFLDSSSMTKFRRRLGAKGMRILQEVINETLISEKRICPRSQFVDTTAQPKNIEYPTDASLLDKGRQRVARTIRRLKREGVELGRGIRSFHRLSKRVMVQIHKLGKDRKQRVEGGLKELIAYSRQVVNRVPQVVEGSQKRIGELLERGEQKAAQVIKRLGEQLKADAEIVKRVIYQTEERLRGVHIRGKIYSLHEPHVSCIRKGKRSRPDEYGTKVRISIDRNGYVVEHQEYASNPCDSETLDESCKKWERIFGVSAKELGADRGFHSNARSPTPHLDKIEKVSIPTKGRKPHFESQKSWFKRLQRQRAKMEPIIGHLKADHRMDRCRYKGFEGDQINVSLVVIAWNLRKWGKHLVAQAS